MSRRIEKIGWLFSQQIIQVLDDPINLTIIIKNVSFKKKKKEKFREIRKRIEES